MSDGVAPTSAGITQRAVVYYWEQEDLEFLPEQRKAVEKYVQEKNIQVVAEYTDRLDKKRKVFPLLEQAVAFCVKNNVRLLIARLHNLTTSEEFTDILLKNKVNFVCLDRPTINPYTLAAVVEEINQRRREHSARIRAGLEHTTAQLGNPNALKEITRVNRPKTENAVMFGLILLPIIGNYKRQGFSQRKMVDELNGQGYLAPEGGKWVLSQLQKVLERIDLTVITLNSASTLEDCQSKNYNDEQTIRVLNALSIRSPQRGGWSLDALHEVQERLDLINEIGNFNNFVLDIYPQILKSGEQGLSDMDVAKQLNEQRVLVPERVLWEIAQEKPEGTAIENSATAMWDADKVKLARELSARREIDILQFLNMHTYEDAQKIMQQ
ncbi:MAG: recombinase family protein [Gammaproteobacteria bacterium]